MRYPVLAIAVICLVQGGCSTSKPEPATAPSQAASQSPGQPGNASPAAQPASPEQPGSSAPAPAGGESAPPAAESTPPPRTFTIASGRTLAVYTTATLTTKANKTGDPFTATLAVPIVDGDWVIAQKGATVEGVIANSDPGGRVKGVASISVQLTRLTLADGRAIPISTSAYLKQARTTKGKDAKKIGIGAGAGAVIGAIAGGRKGALIGAGVGGGAGTGVVLATRGDPAVIPGESQLKVRLKAPVVVTQR